MTSTADRDMTAHDESPADINGADVESIDVDNADDSQAKPETLVGWTASEWLGKLIIARDGEKIGKLHDVYVDVETDVPQFGTVKEGFFGRHLTFVPLIGASVSPDEIHVTVLKEQVSSAPDLDLNGQEMTQEDESALYHHFELNYTAITNESGRRLARR
jgi:hypothetical protein